MYSLRTLHINGSQWNTVLGETYELVKYEAYNAEQSSFNNLINTRLSKGGSYMSKEELENYMATSKHYATIVFTNGAQIDLFNDGTCYYVMLNGNTFDNLTKR